MNLTPHFRCSECAHRPVCDIAKAFNAFIKERYEQNAPIIPDAIGNLCALHTARIVTIRGVEEHAQSVMENAPTED